MIIRKATIDDKDIALGLLDEFRADCIEQITGKPAESHIARDNGSGIYESCIARKDYCILLLEDTPRNIVGVITGYLCPMLRSGAMRAEIEEFFVKKEYRGNGNATKLMDAFFTWCKKHSVQKVNLESDNELHRAHSFYQKYGFKINAARFNKKITI